MMRWHRWEAVIIGLESGRVSDLPFIRFRHERDARAWVARMNAAYAGRHRGGLTTFDYRRLALTDHPHTDPGDGRTECDACGKWVFPVTHSCKRVPVTDAARERRTP